MQLRWIILLISFALLSCTESTKNKLTDGVYRVELNTQDKVLPFNFEVKTEEGEQSWVLMNANERLELNEISYRNDSVFVPLFIFDASLEARVLADGQLEGYYVKHDTNELYEIPFTAKKGSDRFRFEQKQKPIALIQDTWSMTFTQENGKTIEAVGVFNSDDEGKLTASILKTTGDFRFLEGSINGNQLRLSTFDGAHAYLIEATISADGQRLEEGHFYSGKSRHDRFTAFKNDFAELPDSDQLTYLKEGYESFGFSFPDTQGNTVSLADQRFKDKAVIVQIFGTWCPNCMDETAFLADWYNENKARGVEIVALSYEVKDNFDYAVSRVNRMANKLNADYTFLIAGVSDTQKASETLPMLNRVMAFPTMIILNKEHEIERIHTGFNGPGTGAYYEQFVTDFNHLMDGILD